MRYKNGLDDSRQNHSEDKEGDRENQKTEVESLNDNQSKSDVILLDEYDHNIELEGKLLSQGKDLKNLWNYVDLLWDDCLQNRRRLLHLELVTKVNLRKDNDDIQTFSPSTPVCDKTIQTPSLSTQSFPSIQENSISQIEDEHHHLNKAQIKPPTLQSEDRSLTSIKEENSLLLVENKKQKEEVAISHQQSRSLNEELNCLSEKLQQSSAEKKDLEEHAFSAALEENNKLKEHSCTQVAYSSKPKGRNNEIPPQNFRTPTNN